MTDNDHGLHKQFCLEAREIYLASRNAEQGELDWNAALSDAKQVTEAAFVDSDNLSNIAGALTQNGGHMLVFRYFFAPPISQDQFKLICPTWPKSSEKNGRPVSEELAMEISGLFAEWRSNGLIPWIASNLAPSDRDLDVVKSTISHLIAQQLLATARRNRLASEQEAAVVNLLTSHHWTRLHSKLIDKRGDVPKRHFMHKTRFASGTSEHQEVDIACGLGDAVVLAVECKVTNDETNSVKRINDVIKKAGQWRSHFGNFVKPAALLQGVIKPSEIDRLVEANIEIFWSHRLDEFLDWLDSKA